MAANPKSIVGPLFTKLDRPQTPSQVRRLILQTAIGMEMSELERVAINIQVRWVPTEHGTKIPSMVLAILISSEVPISKVTQFASSGAYLAATTDQVMAFCPETDTVRTRIWELGVAMDQLGGTEQAQDAGRHYLVNVSKSASDWKSLAELLLDKVADLRKNVVRHYIESCPVGFLSHFVDGFVLASFTVINRTATLHPGHHVAYMHWILSGLEKTLDRESAQAIMDEFFNQLKFVPYPIRERLNRLAQHLNLQAVPARLVYALN